MIMVATPPQNAQAQTIHAPDIAQANTARNVIFITNAYTAVAVNPNHNNIFDIMNVRLTLNFLPDMGHAAFLVAAPAPQIVRCITGRQQNPQTFTNQISNLLVTKNEHNAEEAIHQATGSYFNIKKVMRNGDFPQGTLKLTLNAPSTDNPHPSVSVEEVAGNLVVDLSNIPVEYILEHPNNFHIGSNFDARISALEALWSHSSRAQKDDPYKFIVSISGENIADYFLF
jgi:hypothetical protein